MAAKRGKKASSTTANSDRICNLVPSVGTETDWRLDDAFAAGALAAAGALPPAVDLREDWWEIGDQEATGSCVGWATGDGLMRYLLVKAGKLAPTDHVSSRYVWMASKETDEIVTRPETFIEASGTMLKAAAQVCTRYGVVTTDLLPFHLDTTLYAGRENEFWAAAAQLRATAFINMDQNLEGWKDRLALGQPVLVGFQVDASWDAAKSNGGEIKDFQPATVRGGHAVALVGYREDGAFIVRNSWGTTNWGDEGFGYVHPEYIAEAFFPESYVLTM